MKKEFLVLGSEVSYVHDHQHNETPFFYRVWATTEEEVRAIIDKRHRPNDDRYSGWELRVYYQIAETIGTPD